MKRKVFSILLTLVLVLSFSLMTAVPAAADPGTLYVRPYTLTSGGSTGTAEWSTAQHHTGSYSVKMYAPASAGDGFSKVVMPLDTTFSDLTDFSVWVEGEAGTEQALPLLGIEVDESTLPTDVDLSGGNNHAGGTNVDLSSYTRVVITSQPGQMEDLSDTLVTDTSAGFELYGTHDTATIDVGTGRYWTIQVEDGGTNFFDYFTWAEIQTALSGVTVTDVAVQLVWPQLDGDEGGAYLPVASTVYIDDITINDTTYYGLIQDAIDTAIADDTISVAAGTYNENVDVDKSLTLTGASSATVTVNAAEPQDHVFEVTASSVTISGFTASGANFLELPPIDVGDGIEISGCAGIYFALYAGVTDCNIHDNILTDNIYGILLLEPEDTVIPGNNTFTSNTATNNIVAGIEMQHTCGNTFTSNTASSNHPEIETTGYGFTLDSSRGNIFTGNTANGNGKYGFWLKQGDGVDGSSGNTFTDNTANLNGRSGVRMTNLSGNSTYTGNTFNLNGTVEYAHRAGMELGGSTGDAISNLTVNNNTFSGNPTGILIRAGAIITDVVLRNNNIVGNADYGANNLGTGTLDATCNWWGDVAGPAIDTNPYVTGGNAVSSNVDYIPWLIQNELVADWNIWSRPIAPDTASETQMQADLVAAGIEAIYYFDSSTQLWGADPDDAGLLDAFYFKMPAATTIRYCISDEATFPAWKDMKTGWNFIGLAQLYEMETDAALIDAFWGTGETGLFGYQRVMSPGLNERDPWMFVRGDGKAESMYPTMGYWVFMVNDGTLGGFTSTPIVEVE